MMRALAASEVGSPPPCGEGLEVGVSLTQNLCLIPPSLTLPRIRLRPKAGFGGQERGGNGESVQGGGEHTVRVARER